MKNLSFSNLRFFIFILGYLMGDGCVEGQPYYSQQNKQGLENFKDKVQFVFGKFESKNHDKELFIPKLVPKFIKLYYKIKSFSTHKTRVPQKLFKEPELHKLSFLSSFLIDEGGISDKISIHSSNYKVLEGLRMISLSLGIKVLLIENIRDMYELKISREKENILNLIRKLNYLKEKFPLCDLVHKQYKLDIIYSLFTKHRYPYRFKYNKENLEKKILKILSVPRKDSLEYLEISKLPTEYGYTTSELQSLLWLKYKYPINCLNLRLILNGSVNKDVIENIYFNERRKIWGLKEHQRILSPDNKILNILRGKNLSIRELSKETDLPFNFVEYRLRKVLVKENLVKKNGQIKVTLSNGRIINVSTWGVNNN